MNTKIADLGEQFLLTHNDTYKLETEYDFDGERVFIQLTNKDNGDCTVFDGSDIFRQVYEFISKGSTEQQEKQYRLSMNGQDFTGTAEDIARWYCKHENIKLYIEPDTLENDGSFILWGQFQNNKTGTLISYFEKDETDIESAYRLFFNDYMLHVDNAGYSIADLS